MPQPLAHSSLCSCGAWHDAVTGASLQHYYMLSILTTSSCGIRPLLLNVVPQQQTWHAAAPQAGNFADVVQLLMPASSTAGCDDPF